MNLFRKNANDELTVKMGAYEVQISELEKALSIQDEKIQSLIDTVQSLTNTVDVKETELVEKNEVIETQEAVIETQETVIQEVIENTVTVEKQASQMALNILSEMGVKDAVEVIDGPEEIDIMAKMKNLKGKELVDFYRSNKQELKNQFNK